MIDHRHFIASLYTSQRREMTRKLNTPAAIALAIHAGLILFVGSMIDRQMPFWPALMPVQGVLLVFLFTLLHETVHRTAFDCTF